MRYLIAAAIWAAFLLPASGAAAPACSVHDDMVAFLAERYGEHTAGRGVSNRGVLMELFSTADGSTWTWVVTVPGRPSCMVAAGVGWTGRARMEEGEGA